MKKLFKILPAENRKNKVIHVRVSVNEFENISASARARNLSDSEFIRRAALGRRTDIKYESQIILSLDAVIKSILCLHTAVVEFGILPHESEWSRVIDEAVAAMQRICK